MLRYYNSKAGRLWFIAHHTFIGVVGAALALLGLLTFFCAWVTLHVPDNYFISSATLDYAFCEMLAAGASFIVFALLTFLAAYIIYITTPDSERIRHAVQRGLSCGAYGNILGLRPGQLLPKVSCFFVSPDHYDVIIRGDGIDMEALAKCPSQISNLISGRLSKYAVVSVECAPDCCSAVLHVEDVSGDHTLTFESVEEMRNDDPTKIMIQEGTSLDLKSSGSLLVSGKTRSGKTTGIAALLIQILLQGRDDFGSEVIIVDPKVAELSVLPNVATLDEDGGARKILAAMRRFAESIVRRQAILNDLSSISGDAVRWWEAHMRPSFLVLDEFVSLRSLFPKKPDKSDPDYSLAAFDELLKRIVTMGQSSGAFTIISIAQASVDEGGLPSMLRSAMGTKILFRPTLEEGRFLWPGSVLEPLALARKYPPGSAWASSMDGVHDAPGYVHFPDMKFPVYAELGRLLKEYYGD